MAKWRTQKRWFKGSNVGGDGMLPTHGCWPVIRVDVPLPHSPVGGGKAKTRASTNGFADLTRKSWRSCYQIVILSMKYKARSLTETLGMGKSLKREENDWKNHDKQWVTYSYRNMNIHFWAVLALGDRWAGVYEDIQQPHCEIFL